MMASATLLVVYAAVKAAHLKVRSQTGARTWVVVASLVACSTMFVLLMVYTRAQSARGRVDHRAGYVGRRVRHRGRVPRWTGRRYRTLAEGAAPPAPVVTVPTVATST